MKMILLFCFCLSACAPLTEQEKFDRAYRHAEDEQKWEACKMVYKANRQPTYSRHTHQRGRKHRPHEVRDDLLDNACDIALRGVSW